MTDKVDGFVNFDVNVGITVNTYRKPQGYYNDEIGGLVDDILADRCGCCPLDGALDVLEDGSYWNGSNATSEILEDLHQIITLYMAAK